MTRDDLEKLSYLFTDPNPDEVMSKLNQLTREERKSLAELFFELTRRVYGTTLENSIRVTFRKIHTNMERMFFDQIFQMNEKLRTQFARWNEKLTVLREIDLFAETSVFDLLNIAENTIEVRLKANEPFITQYEPVEGVFLLKDAANVYEFNSTMPVIARNGIFGDDACATGELEASMTVKPMIDCTAFFIPRERFVRLIRSVPGLQEKVFQSVVERAKQGSIRADEQRRLTQEILDNIGQGSFSINVAGEIGENYTKLAADYLGTENLAGIPFADLAFRNNREVLRNYYRALHMLFSGTDFNHNVVLDLLPKEVSINRREFNLHYSFVQDGAGHVMSVFVRMEDVTLQKEIARKEERERAITEKMQSNVGGFMNMLEEVQDTFTSLERFAEEYWVKGIQPENRLVNEFLRSLHGSKGLSGQFELTELKSVIHDFEDWFLKIDREGIQKHADSFQELFSEFEQRLEYALSFKDNLGEGIIEILNGVSFNQEQYAVLENAAREGDIEKIRSIILSKNNIPAQKIVSNWQRDAMRLAERLGKVIEITFDVDEELTLPKDLVKDLNVNLGHLYRNCVDHGIESPDERSAAGKPETGKIRISIGRENGHFAMSVEDDGRGIDADKISRLARGKTALDQTEVERFIEAGEVWRILFMAGFSSKEQATDVSGRGVGMDAVQNVIKEWNGELDLKSELNKGTRIDLRIPLETE